MKLGFTGTRKGTTAPQHKALWDLLERLAPTEFHHGDCVGADDEAADLVALVRAEKVRIVSHPPIDQPYRALNGWHDEERPPMPYLARNRAIVAATDALVACPAEMANSKRGGTWYTVDYAMKHNKPVWVVWPDGTVSEPKEAKELKPPPKGEE